MIREIRMREGGREGGEVGRKIGRQFYFSSIWRNTRAKRKKKKKVVNSIKKSKWPRVR